MKAQPLDLPGVLRLDKPVHRDERGLLVELMRADELAAAGVPATFAQHNHSRSVRGVIRGMHWQRDPVQAKLVTVVRGRVLDVVAEIRPGRPGYGRHVAVVLEPGTSLWVPAGYAHGFLVLSEDADVVYGLTAPYAAGEGRGVRWDDPALAIPWPVGTPVLSPADAALPFLADLPDEDLPVEPA